MAAAFGSMSEQSVPIAGTGSTTLHSQVGLCPLFVFGYTWKTSAETGYGGVDRVGRTEPLVAIVNERIAPCAMCIRQVCGNHNASSQCSTTFFGGKIVYARSYSDKNVEVPGFPLKCKTTRRDNK